MTSDYSPNFFLAVIGVRRQYKKRIVIIVTSLFENLALVECSSFFVSALPLPVLIYQLFGFIRLAIKLLPVIASVVNLPIVIQLKCEFMTLKHPDSRDGTDSLWERLVVHLHRLDLSGKHVGGEGDNHTGLDDTSLNSSYWNCSNTSNFVNILEGQSERLV